MLVLIAQMIKWQVWLFLVSTDEGHFEAKCDSYITTFNLLYHPCLLSLCVYFPSHFLHINANYHYTIMIIDIIVINVYYIIVIFIENEG